MWNSSVDALSKHYGVRVTYRTDGRPLVDVSHPSSIGHAENVVERPGTVKCTMIRFRGDRILFTAELDENDRLVLPMGSLAVHEKSAVVIQRAFRRHAALGDPVLPMPPVRSCIVLPRSTR